MADDLQVLINVKSNADEATRGLDKLGSSVAKNLKVVERLQKQYKVLADGFNKGKITAQVYAAEVTKVENAINRLNASNNAAAKSTKKMAEAQMAATKASNRMGVVTQQAGYQVSDFIVQVQSGTNVFVAFGQQASQLVGVLPLVADKIGLTARAAIALSASLGIIIPLVTLFGASWLRSREAAEDAGDKLRTTEDILKDLKSSISDADKELRLLHSTFTDITQLEVVDQMKKLEQQIQFIKNEGAEAVREYVKALGGSEAMLQNAEASIAALAAGKQEQIDTLQANLDTLIAKQKLLEVEESYAELLGEINDIEEETASKNLEILSSLRERQALAEAYLAGGDEAVKKEERLREVMALVTELQSDQYDFTEAQIQAILRQVKAAQDLEDSVEDAKEETKALEEAAKDAAAAFEKMSSFSEGLDEKIAVVTAELKALGSGGSTSIAKTVAQLNYQADALYESKKATGELTQADKDLYTETKAQIAAYNAALILIEDKEAALKAEEKATREAAKAYKKQLQEAEKLRKELEGPMVSAIDGVSNAFGDFIARGLQDFKGFVNQILGSFQSMIAQMIATAARNRIMISLGLGGAGFATGAGAVGTTAAMGGPLGAFIGTTGAAGVAGTGFMGGLTAGVTGGLGNIFSVGANAAAAGGGFAATLGAAVPAIAAVAAVVGLFTKKTKLLDSGLRTTVEGFDVAIDTFAKTQSSRLFGLLKGRKKTTYTAAEAELADPLVQAIGDMQQSIVDAAGTLGIGADAFDNFSYQFKLSLKGLTEEEQLQKINEEILKMGDAFASLTGYFSTMNELLAVAQQRYDLTTRLLQLQGNEEELIARYREQERAATHELNQDLLDQIYALEDQQRAVQQLTDAYNEASAVANQAERDLSAANGALAEAERNVQQAANELQRLLDESLDTALAGLERAIDARRDSINQKYDTLISGLEDRLDAANEAASRSAEVYSILSGALSGRSVGGITFASRQAARAYIAGGGSDVERLQSAVEVLSEPSRQLFGSFEDYARDFAITSNVLKESKDAAQAQMTADEKTVALLQEQIEQADREREDQLRLLDEQLEAAKLQIEALKGIDTTILSVDEAMKNVRDAMATYEQTQANHVELNTSVLSIGEAITQLASAVNAQAAAQAAAAAAQQAQAAAAAKAAEAQQQLAVAQSGAVTDVNSTAAKMSLDTAAKISAATPASASEQAMLNRFSGGERPDHIQLAIAKGYQYDPVRGGYRKFATGGMHSGGLRLVGEQGPELEVTGPSRIYSNSSTRSMLSNPELVAEIKELRREIADTKAEQRAANVAMVKYNKRTSDQLRTWNAVGLPQERTV